MKSSVVPQRLRRLRDSEDEGEDEGAEACLVWFPPPSLGTNLKFVTHIERP